METKEGKQRLYLQVLTGLLLCNLVATIALGCYVFLGVSGEPGGQKPDNQGISQEAESSLEWILPEGGAYVLYVGLNDKDTYEQVISDEEAEEKMNAIITEHVEGYTVYHARGGWVDENQILTQENTLVYIFRDTTEEQMLAIMDEALKVLNQNSILIERQDSPYAFYNGRIQ